MPGWRCPSAAAGRRWRRCSPARCIIGNNLSDTIGAISQGGLRALVVGTRRDRHAAIPQVPTAREAEFEALAEITGWNALYAPAGLPQPLIDAWAEALAALRQDQGWMAATRRVGSFPGCCRPRRRGTMSAPRWRCTATWRGGWG
ncbi:hypothetical protein ACFQU2_22640 [Siccirubricoccus deserti]